MTKRLRADILLVEQGLCESRTKAQSLIMAGVVLADGKPVSKASDLLNSEVGLSLKQPDHPWVSRGGMKLDEAIKHFNIDVSGKTCLDVGASTGGFSDVLLQNGAAKVYAVDVGYGQLHEKVRNNSKVVSLENTNARYLTAELIPDKIDIIVCDASFISLKTVLPAPLALGSDKFIVAALIKPQFEVGKGRVGKGGVVRDESLHNEVCTDIKNWMEEQGLNVLGITESPITGPKGNKEFLIVAEK